MRQNINKKNKQKSGQLVRLSNQRAGNTNFQRSQQQNGTTNRVKGKVRLGDVVTPFSSNDAQAYDLDYLGFVNTRLKAQFETHELWFVHSIAVHYVPMLAATSPGTIVIAPEYDPLDLCPAGASSPDILMNYQRAKSNAITRPFDVFMPNIRLPSGEWCKGMLFTDLLGDRRMNSYGRIMYSVEGHSLGADVTVGFLELSYDISFSIPQLELCTEVSDSDITRVYAGSTAGIITPTAECTTNQVTGTNCTWADDTTAIQTLDEGLVLVGNYLPGTAVLQTSDGSSVPSGSRVYFRPATAVFETASNFVQGWNQYFVGNANFNLLNIAGTALKFIGAASSYFYIRNGKELGRKAST